MPSSLQALIMALPIARFSSVTATSRGRSKVRSCPMVALWCGGMVPRGTAPVSGVAVARVRIMAGIEGALLTRRREFSLGRRRLVGNFNEATLRDIVFIL